MKKLFPRRPAFFIASFLLFSALFIPALSPAHAAAEAASDHHAIAFTFLWIAIILILAKLAGLIERIGQPAVLGELLIGILIGNAALIGVTFFEPLKDNSIISFLAELGVVILLFQIGLESNIGAMKKVGASALNVAIIGAVVPFVLGAYVVGPWLLPNLPLTTYLFLGAALTATSVGITARIFKDLNKLSTKESQVVLGAAVIDDVLGIILLAIVSAIATTGSISFASIGLIFGKAILFLTAAVVLGRLLAPRIGLLFSKINAGSGMKLSFALAFGLGFAFVAQEIGLATIVGAFAAGLILDAVCFRHFDNPHIVESMEGALKDADERTKSRVSGLMQRHSAQHVENLIEPIAHLVVPIFFVLTGMQVNLLTFFNGPIFLTALGITVVAFAGKILAGIAAGKGRNKWIVGFAMAPRGEVGLIFASIGATLGVLTENVFSIIIIMVILTTLFTPPVLMHLLKRGDARKKAPTPTRPTPSPVHTMRS